MKEAIKLVANNKKAYHDYFIDEKFECGIELFGTEVKSIRMGKCSVKEAFVRIDKNEVYIYGTRRATSLTKIRSGQENS